MIQANDRLSDHLSLAEVRCRCFTLADGPYCDGGMLRAETVLLFERIRARSSEYLGRDCPLRITSGVRCERYNRRIGGAPQSRHLTGQALDLRFPPGIPPDEFHRICLEETGPGGCGLYTWGVHIDTHETDPPRRWRVAPARPEPVEG